MLREMRAGPVVAKRQRHGDLHLPPRLARCLLRERWSLDWPERVRVRLGLFGSALRRKVILMLHLSFSRLCRALSLFLLVAGSSGCIVNPVPTPDNVGAALDKGSNDDAQNGVAGGGKDTESPSGGDVAGGIGDATADTAADVTSDVGEL